MRTESSDTKSVELSRPFSRELGNLALRLNVPSSLDATDTLIVGPSGQTYTIHYSNSPPWTTEMQSVADAPKSTFTDWFASLSFLSNSLTSVTAAALFNWLSLFGRGNSTVPINVPSLLYVEHLLRRSTILVSPRLRMSRSQVVATALTPPSGTLLTWAEVLAEERDG